VGTVLRMLRPFVLVLAVAACGYPKPGPPPGRLGTPAIEAARLRFPTSTADSLEQGRQVFLQHCNRCHKYPALGAYSDSQWAKIIPRMSGKATLNTAQNEQVLQFVLAATATATR